MVLLTATPFNNHPNDFFSLLKLFMPTKKTSLVLDGNLADAFRGYGIEFAAIHEVLKHRGKTDGKTMEKIAKSLVKLGIEPAQYVQNPQAFIRDLRKRAKRLAEQVRQVIEPVTIRRNRIDLKTDPDYRKDVKGLPVLQDPVEQFFVLTEAQDRFYDRVINETFGEDSRFHGAIYRPYLYAAGADADGENQEVVQQANMYKFMRRLLVRRFESSFGAFAKSLDNAIRMHGHVEDFAKRTGKMLIDRTLRKIFLPDLATASGVEKIRKLLDQLIAEMGRNYLERYRQEFTEDEIIVGIEHRSKELEKS